MYAVVFRENENDYGVIVAECFTSSEAYAKLVTLQNTRNDIEYYKVD